MDLRQRTRRDGRRDAALIMDDDRPIFDLDVLREKKERKKTERKKEEEREKERERETSGERESAQL